MHITGGVDERLPRRVSGDLAMFPATPVLVLCIRSRHGLIERELALRDADDLASGVRVPACEATDRDGGCDDDNGD